jgi:hypothetical protein
VIQSARIPEVMNVFSPSMTQVAPCAAAQPGDIGAARRFGDRECGDLRAGEHLGDDAALQRFAAVRDQRRQADVVREQARHQPAAAGARDLLGRDQAKPRIGRGAAIGLGIAQAEQPDVRGAPVERARESLRLVPCVDVRRDLGGDEGAHAVAEQLVLGRGLHPAISISTWRAAT